MSRAKKVAIVMFGFKWPPLTGLKAKMNRESRMKFETPPTSAPRKGVVAKMPAAVVGGLDEVVVSQRQQKDPSSSDTTYGAG